MVTWLPLILACTTNDITDETPDIEAPAEDTAATVEEEPAELDAIRLLSRASLDLRGVRPSLDELSAVRSDPSSVTTLVESFLDDPRLSDRVVALFSEIYQTQSDTPLVKYASDDYPALAEAMGEEPLRIVAHIAVNDLPYTEVVTADWTMATPELASVWPLSYPDGAEGWQPASYTDDRPSAGVLSTNSLWWRYTSTLANANRGRANAVSRILLCSDYLSRPIDFDRDVDLLDEGAITEALRTNEGCVGCHNTLDPLASYLWGFYYTSAVAVDAGYYHPEREQWWAEQDGLAPSFYGEPSYTLEDLGEQLAADPRLVSCVTEQVFTQLLQRDAGIGDMDTLTALRESFLDEGLLLRTLLREVVLGEAYRSLDPDVGTPYKLTRPAMLASALEDLTGYRFTADDFDMMTTDTVGLRTLAGGIDGGFVTAPATDVNATMALVYERLAQAAARSVVAHDKAHPDEARLFTEIGFTETPEQGTGAMATQLQRLHLRLLGAEVELDGVEIEANLTLWSDLYALEGDPAAAWSGLLSVLLRDPDFLFY
ncbi:MAG: hypothetical protein ACI8S6_002852 [Myxococcota bacterium]|jgi:hypothetical protein